jgi:hypothetical protein
MISPNVRICRQAGYWTVELRDGDELVMAYIGEANVRDALERARLWLRNDERTDR